MGAAINPPMPDAELKIARASARFRTNHFAMPACAPTTPPIATPMPTTIPNARAACRPLFAMVAMKKDPIRTSRLPVNMVSRTPNRPTHIAARGPGSPDMIV